MATVTPLKQHKQHLTTDQNSEVQRRGPPRSAKSGNSSWTTSMAAADEQMRTPQKLNQQQPCRRVLPSKDSLAPSAIIGSKKRRAMGSGEVGGYSAGFNEDSDLIRNGRALLAATTTTLGTPAEISNKRRRTMADHHNNAHNELTVPATPNKITLRLTLGPKQANGNAAIADPTGGETGSRKQGSTGKRSSKKAQRTKDDERRILQEREALEWKQKYSKAFKSFIFYFDTIEESKKQNAEKCVGALGAVRSFSYLSPIFKKEYVLIFPSTMYLCPLLESRILLLEASHACHNLATNTTHRPTGYTFPSCQLVNASFGT